MLGKTADQIYYDDIIAVCSQERKWVHFYYTLSIVTDKGDYQVSKVLSIQSTKDYEIDYTENFVAECHVTKGFYQDILYPIRDNFEVILHAVQVPEKEQGMRLVSREKWQRRYRGAIVNPIDLGNNTKTAETPLSMDTMDKERSNIAIQLQLVPTNMDSITKMTVGGIFNGIPGNVVKGLLSETVKHIISRDEDKLEGIDIVEPDIKKTVNEILIPHGTKILDLPRYVQKNWMGIYNNGIGSFIRDNIWYIYPLYDFTRYDKEKTKLTISVVPKAKMMDCRRTYTVFRREVNVICHGDVNITDNTTINQINEGDGITAWDTDKFKNESVTKDDKGNTYFNAESMKTQYIKDANKAGLSYAPVNQDKLTTSVANLMSEVARRNGIVMTFVWEYANIYLLAPGMAVKVIYWKDGERYEANGVLLKETGIAQLEGGLTAKRHSASVALGVLVDKQSVSKVEQKQYSDNLAGKLDSFLDGIRGIFD